MSEVPPSNSSGLPDKNARTMAMLAHLLGIFTGVVGPLIVWLVKKDEDPFIDDQGKEAVNFQITILIASGVSFALVFVLVGFLLLPVVIIYHIIGGIIAAMKANEGIAYRYPMALRLVN
jgi:uncharacterized protein